MNNILYLKPGALKGHDGVGMVLETLASILPLHRKMNELQKFCEINLYLEFSQELILLYHELKFCTEFTFINQ